MTRTGKATKVTMPSHGSTTLGENVSSIAISHRYASSDAIAVQMYTPICLTARVSPLGMETTQTAMIMRRLKAALPTMVEGPSAPLYIPLPKSSITDSRISGADEPSAMSVRLAIVGFQMRT